MKEFFSQAEAARYLGYSTRTIRRAAASGLLPKRGAGRAARFARRDLEAVAGRLSRRRGDAAQKLG